MVKIAEQFDRTGAIVVGRQRLPSAATWSPRCAATRRWPRPISTVDNANTAQGQVVTALALAEQLTGRRPGSTASATTPPRCCLDCPVSERRTPVSGSDEVGA